MTQTAADQKAKKAVGELKLQPPLWLKRVKQSLVSHLWLHAFFTSFFPWSFLFSCHYSFASIFLGFPALSSRSCLHLG